MNNSITQSSGLLKQGFNVLGGAVDWVRDKVSYAGEFYANKFFPTSQKTKIIPSIVSNQPYTSFFGFRTPIQKDAGTVNSPWYQRWWDSSVKAGSTIWDRVTGMFQSEKQKAATSTINTLWSTAGKIAQSAINTLPAYFNNKWGLKARAASGESLGNTPVREQTPIIYYNDTQSNSPATEPGIFGDLISYFQRGSQPQGTYSLANPQQAPIPASSIGGILPPNIAIIAIIGIGAWLFLRKK